MEPTIKQLQETITIIKEALVNWRYVVARGTYTELPISKYTVHPSRGLCTSFFEDYPYTFLDEMWSELKSDTGSILYPVAGKDEFFSSSYPFKRWANPERKALAERCVPYLQAKLEAALLKDMDHKDHWDAVAEHLDVVDLPSEPYTTGRYSCS